MFHRALILLTAAATISSGLATNSLPSSRALRKVVRVRGGGGASELFAAYDEALKANPVVTKCSTSLVGFAAGDILAQTAIEKKGFDLKRLIRMASFGFLIHGSTGHFFYNWLDSKIPGNDIVSTFSKVAVDQTLWAPIFMCMFFTYMHSFDLDFGAIIPAIKSKTFNAVQASWKTWIPAHTINFKFIPSDYRILYINAIQIGFNCFLSIIGSKKVTKEA